MSGPAGAIHSQEYTALSIGGAETARPTPAETG